MNLRQLRYFLAVAEELHFSRAAKRLNMAQPPLSMQIKQLESDLGVQLFKRTKRQVNLTPAGSVLRTEAQQILERVALAEQKTQRAGRGETGHLAIAFVSSAMYSVLPPWIKTFRQHYPRVNLTLQAATGPAQVEKLLSQQLDIGFVRPPVGNHKVASQVVWREPMVAALSKEHPLSEKREIEIADLRHQPFILDQSPLASDMYDKIISFCQQANFCPNVIQAAQQLQTMLGLVAAQIGVAIAAAQKLQIEGVCYRRFIETTPTLDLLMIWRAEETLPLQENWRSCFPRNF